MKSQSCGNGVESPYTYFGRAGSGVSRLTTADAGGALSRASTRTISGRLRTRAWVMTRLLAGARAIHQGRCALARVPSRSSEGGPLAFPQCNSGSSVIEAPSDTVRGLDYFL